MCITFKKLILLFYILKISVYMSLSFSDEISYERSIEILNLAYMSWNDPQIVEKIINQKNSKISLLYNKMIKGYSLIGKLDNLFEQVGNFCIIKNYYKGDVCTFNYATNSGGYLYVTGYSEINRYLLTIISFDSPERTIFLRWNEDYKAELLYDSFSKSQNPCYSDNDNTPLRLIKKIKTLTQNSYLLFESGNRETELKRKIVLNIQSRKCSYVVEN